MARWMQKTYANGELKYEPKMKTDNEMMERFAQIIFLKQAGEDIELHQTVNDNYEAVEYTATLKLKDRTVVHVYTMEG